MAPIATGYKSSTTKANFISMNILVFGKDGQLGKAFHVLLDSGLPALSDKPNISPTEVLSPISENSNKNNLFLWFDLLF